jgi:alkaline phosphatase D
MMKVYLIIIYKYIGYKKVRESIPVIGVWDDHDYGLNNGNILNERKDIMKEIYLNFINESSTSDRRI